MVFNYALRAIHDVGKMPCHGLRVIKYIIVNTIIIILVFIPLNFGLKN